MTLTTIFTVIVVFLLSVFVLLTLADLVMLAIDHWKEREKPMKKFALAVAVVVSLCLAGPAWGSGETVQ